MGTKEGIRITPLQQLELPQETTHQIASLRRALELPTNTDTAQYLLTIGVNSQHILSAVGFEPGDYELVRVTDNLQLLPLDTGLTLSKDSHKPDTLSVNGTVTLWNDAPFQDLQTSFSREGLVHFLKNGLLLQALVLSETIKPGTYQDIIISESKQIFRNQGK